MGFSMYTRLFGIVFSIVFVFVIGMFAVTIIQGIREWNANNHSPKLTVEARLVSKRTKVSSHRQAVAGDITGAHGYHTSTSTRYYVTFEVESGDRMEFHIDGKDYGMLAEGDSGWLTFQGTRYLGFERHIYTTDRQNLS